MTNNSVNTDNLSKEEQASLKSWVEQVEAAEMAQVQELIAHCNVSFQFAKTYKVYQKDWKKTKAQMEGNLKSGKMPPGVSANLHRAIIAASDEVMQKKFERVRVAFKEKFGEPIENYLDPVGKAKGFFGFFR